MADHYIVLCTVSYEIENVKLRRVCVCTFYYGPFAHCYGYQVGLVLSIHTVVCHAAKEAQDTREHINRKNKVVIFTHS